MSDEKVKEIEISPEMLARGREALRDWLGGGRDSLTLVNQSADQAILQVIQAVFRKPVRRT